MSITLSPEAIHHAEVLFSDADASRFLSAAGLVMLLYDHLLTLPDEISLIWRARPSFAKYGFLFNRYLVPTCLIVIATEMAGLSGHTFTKMACRQILSVIAITAIFSVGIANILVLLRVVLLWEKNRTVIKLLCFGFIIGFISSLSMMILTLKNLYGGMQYNPIVRMCITTTFSPSLIGVWASPMLFELIVLGSTCWNAFDRPRDVHEGLTKALHRDGITFFFALTILRTINLVLASLGNPAQTMLGVFFVWSMTTLILNRSLLRLQRAEVIEERRAKSSGTRAASPFGIVPDSDEEDLSPMSPMTPDAPTELVILNYTIPIDTKGRQVGFGVITQ